MVNLQYLAVINYANRSQAFAFEPGSYVEAGSDACLRLGCSGDKVLSKLTGDYHYENDYRDN